jgi:hypothetical protein
VKSKDETEKTAGIPDSHGIYSGGTFGRRRVQQHGLYQVWNSCVERLIVHMIEWISELRKSSILRVSFSRTLQGSMKKSNPVAY